MFPRGAAELVEYFMQAGNLSLSNTLSSATFGPDVPPNERIAFGVKARLEYIIPYIHSWPQAMALGLLPHNLPYTLTSLAHAVDEMWYFAGDKSHDMAWYSRRALLLTVYTSTGAPTCPLVPPDTTHTPLRCVYLHRVTPPHRQVRGV